MKKSFNNNYFGYLRSKMDNMSKEDFIEFQKRIDEEHDKASRKLFTYIEQAGEEIYSKKSPLNKFIKKEIFQKMIDHFLLTEEYEKCALLKKISDRLKSQNI
jgi:hypothetical protein